MAGPRVLEHIVDTVLYFEGDRHTSYRILRVRRQLDPQLEISVFECGKRTWGSERIPSQFMLNGHGTRFRFRLSPVPWKEQRPILLPGIQALV